jgi:hypothetical protein
MNIPALINTLLIIKSGFFHSKAQSRYPVLITETEIDKSGEERKGNVIDERRVDPVDKDSSIIVEPPNADRRKLCVSLITRVKRSALYSLQCLNFARLGPIRQGVARSSSDRAIVRTRCRVRGFEELAAAAKQPDADPIRPPL